jgi:ABC-type antimicrobial peptide transport system permease subunit
VSYSYYLEEVKQTFNSTFVVTGIMNPTTLGNNPIQEVLSDYLENFLIFMDFSSFFTALQSTEETISSLGDPFYSLSCETIYFYEYDLTRLNRYNVLHFLSNYIEFGESRAWYDILDNDQFYVSSNRLNQAQFQYKIDWYNIFFYTFLVLLIPIWILSFYLIRFSSRIINEKRKKSFVLYKMRGVSSRFLFILLSCETFILGLLASFLGLLLGIPIAYLIGTSKNFLQFDFSHSSLSLVIPQGTIDMIVCLGIVFAFLTQIRALRRFSYLPLAILEQESSKTQERKPKIFGKQFDLFLLGAGSLGIIVLTLLVNIIKNPQISSSISQDLQIILFAILALLAVISPIVFIVGAVLSLNRLIPVALFHLSRFCWIHDYGLLATALRNLSANIKVTRRITILTALSLSFLIILSILPITIANYSTNNVYLENGCDIRIYSGPSELPLLPNVSAQLNNLSGVTSTIVSRTYFEGGDFYFYGIPSEFSQIAYWQPFFDEQSLADLVSTLETSVNSYPVIINERTAKMHNLKEKNTLEIALNDTSSITISVEKISTYWPGIVTPWGGIRLEFVTTNHVFKNISSLLATSGMKYGQYQQIWCRLASGIDFNMVIEEVRTVASSFGIKNHLVSVSREQVPIYQDSLENQFLWVVINFNFFGSLCVVFTFLIIYMVTRVSSHATEIGLSRALGMKFPQIFLLMFLEPLILFLISGIPGTVIGIFIITSVVNFMNPWFSTTGLPVIITLDLPTLFFMYGTILAITLITGGITSYLASRTNISKILKAE